MAVMGICPRQAEDGSRIETRTRTREHSLLWPCCAAAWLLVVTLACLGSLPWTTARVSVEPETGDTTFILPRRYEQQVVDASLLPPSWASHRQDERRRRVALADPHRFFLGSDQLGRDLLHRCLTGGGISLTIGIAGALIAVLIGTTYGAVAGFCGGRVDEMMMRILDILYGLPNILLVVLFAVAVDGLLERTGSDLSPDLRQVLDMATLLLAIGGVTWLTMARVIRGQVLSLCRRPFMEACRAIGVPATRQFLRHLMPHLAGTILVYGTLAVPAAILAESFLSFLGIGIQEPLPSWGNLAADGLSEINMVRSRWWLLVFPCGLIAMTLVTMNIIGDALRSSLEPRSGTSPGMQVTA